MPIFRSLAIRPVAKTPPSEPVVPVEEKLVIEEIVPDTPAEKEPEIPEKITEEVQAEVTVTEEAPAEEKAQEEITNIEIKTEEQPVTTEEEPAAEVEEEKPAKKTRKKAAKAKAEEEPEEIVHVTNTLGKKQNLRDAVASVVKDYSDPAFDAFKEQLEKDMLLTVFDERADSATIRVILSNLNRCYDNVTREYAKVNKYLEQLANKTYGLIPRQIVMNTAGSNEVTRKKNGVHAPEVYKTESGDTINLYALQAGLEEEEAYLQMILKQLEYRRSSLISYLNASKLEAGIGD